MVVSRSISVLELVVAMAVATGLILAFSATMTSQALELGEAHGQLRAREALLSAQEELRAGILTPPAAGETKTLSAAKPLTLTLKRIEAAANLRAGGKLIAVELRATWRGQRGKTEERKLRTLVVAGGGA